MKKRVVMMIMFFLTACFLVACENSNKDVKEENEIKEETSNGQNDDEILNEKEEITTQEETAVQEETTTNVKDNKKDIPTVENHYYQTSGELYEVIFYNYDDTWNLISTKTMDKDGKLDEMSEYDENGNEICRISYGGNKKIFEYNEQGVLVHELFTDYATGEFVCENWYSEKGELIESIDMCMGPKWHTTTELDEYGNVILEKREIYDDMGQIRSTRELRTEYEYDKDGRVLKKLEYDKHGEKDIEYIYVYDKNGKVISLTETTFKRDENEVDYTLYTYENGVLSYSKEEAIGLGQSQVVEVWYDVNGEILEYIKYIEGKIFASGKFIYEDGRIVRYEEYYADNWMSDTSSLTLVMERQYQTVDIIDN